MAWCPPHWIGTCNGNDACHRPPLTALHRVHHGAHRSPLCIVCTLCVCAGCLPFRRGTEFAILDDFDPSEGQVNALDALTEEDEEPERTQRASSEQFAGFGEQGFMDM